MGCEAFYQKILSDHQYLQADRLDVLGRTNDPELMVARAMGAAYWEAGQNHLYGYANQNPIMNVDPWGLWSISASAYSGVGAGTRVSYSNGTLEIIVNVGVGVGGGFSYDPNGKPSPHSRQCDNGYIARARLGEGSLGGHFGPFGAGFNGSSVAGNVFNNDDGYNEGNAEVTAGESEKVGISAGANMGADFGSYTNW